MSPQDEAWYVKSGEAFLSLVENFGVKGIQLFKKDRDGEEVAIVSIQAVQWIGSVPQRQQKLMKGINVRRLLPFIIFTALKMLSTEAKVLIRLRESTGKFLAIYICIYGMFHPKCEKIRIHPAFFPRLYKKIEMAVLIYKPENTEAEQVFPLLGENTLMEAAQKLASGESEDDEEKSD